ncbi:MAG: 50S ribosomal protein L19e [archaeon]
MNLKVQKRIASSLSGVSPKRIRFNEENLSEIKEAITKRDIRTLIKDKKIIVKQKESPSRSRSRKRLIQKRKGRQQGTGSRKGKRTARLPRKDKWIHKIRVQRRFLKNLKSKSFIDSKIYRQLYKQAKSGFFRSKSHLKTYILERNLIKNGKK